MKQTLQVSTVRHRQLLFVAGLISFMVAGLLATTASAGALHAGQQADGSAGVAAFPFYDGFESGGLGSDWTVHTTNQGRVQVGSTNPYTGTYSLLLDDSQNDTVWSVAAAILTVDLSGQQQVELDFWWDEYNNTDNTSDGVFISANNGANWVRILSFDADPTSWRHQVIDLDEAATAAGLAFNDHFQIKFQFNDDSSIPNNGYSIDEVQVRAPQVPVPAAFPYATGFESGSLGPEWLTKFSNEGRVRVGTVNPHTGNYSLLLDDWEPDSIWSTAAAILTVDLSGQTQAELDFWWDEYNNVDDTSDGVFISADNGAKWVRILSFDADPAGWLHQVIDLDEAAATAGLAFNEDFQIKFQFNDDDSIPDDGYSIDEVQVRPNAAPVLTWPGDPNYQQDGLHPETGDVADSYSYRIRYSDMDDDPPLNAGVHIRKGGVDIAGSPFAMTCPGGSYSTGVVCSYTKVGLEAGDDYTYAFVACDDQGNSTAPTPTIDAPDVISKTRVRLPVVMRDAGPPEGPPILNPIDNPSGAYEYTVSWSVVARATRYTLEEDDNAAFSSPITAYAGSGTSKRISASAVGTLSYRVKASNAFGETGWSNVQSVVVTVPPPPCPQAGTWSGLTDEGQSISYTVADTPTCRVTSLKITARVQCLYPSGSFLYTVEYFTAQPIVGREFEYYYNYNPNNHEERVSGAFDSQTQAHGDAYFMIPNPSNPASFCISLPDWTASHAR